MTTRMNNQKCGSVVRKLNSLGNSGFHLFIIYLFIYLFITFFRVDKMK